NAEGTPIVECRFDYGPTTSYGSSVPCAEGVPTDSKPHPVSAKLTGLDPEQEYHYQLVAKNSAGESIATGGSFMTTGTVSTHAADPVGPTTATLRGSVNPAGRELTSCTFEYLTEADWLANGGDYSG